MGGMSAIARLKITHDDVEPKVVRRIEVPLGIKLVRLHLAMQAASGWTNSHLYEIRARGYEIRAGGVGWGLKISIWPLP